MWLFESINAESRKNRKNQFKIDFFLWKNRFLEKLIFLPALITGNYLNSRRWPRCFLGGNVTLYPFVMSFKLPCVKLRRSPPRTPPAIAMTEIALRTKLKQLLSSRRNHRFNSSLVKNLAFLIDSPSQKLFTSFWSRGHC